MSWKSGNRFSSDACAKATRCARKASGRPGRRPPSTSGMAAGTSGSAGAGGGSGARGLSRSPMETSQEMLGEPLEHQPIAFGAVVIVPRNEVARVPVLMHVRGIQEEREQIYEQPAIAGAELAINLDLAVGAVIVG